MGEICSATSVASNFVREVKERNLT